jgi:hypothetical protein
LNDALEEQAQALPGIWRIIMKSKVIKLAVAAVIIIAVLIGIHEFGSSIDASSVAWAELVERVEQSHNEYYEELLLAIEEKDTEKIEFYADLLSEFWQNLGWLAETELHPELRDRIFTDVAIAKAHYEGRDDSDQIGVRLFLEYEDQFSEWLGNIAEVDVAWIYETVHVCKQLEEYAEEIREPGRHPEIDFSYAEHCLPSFIAYCEWFEQLPWDNPEQVMTPDILLTGIKRDLEIARHELEALQIRGFDRYVKRCIEQAEKNILDLEIKISSSTTKKQWDLCRELTRSIGELSDLITYATIASGDIRQNNEFHDPEAVRRVFTEEFGNKGPFADYYIERIDQSLNLCEQLLSEFDYVQ